MHYLGLTLAAVLAAPIAPQTSAFLYFVPAPAGAAEQVLLAREYDVLRAEAWAERGAGYRVAVAPEQQPVFEHLFPEAIGLGRSRGLGHVAGLAEQYRSPAQVLDAMRGLAEAGGDDVDLVALNRWLGTPRTHGGGSIHALRMGRGGLHDPAIVLVGQLHAREAASGAIVLELATRFAARLRSDPAFLAARTVWIVPIANPDGAEHVWHRDRWWRKNRRYNGGTAFGVDLNRNFDAGPIGDVVQGGRPDPVSAVFRGPRPGSEPEVATLTALLERVRPDVFLDVHTHGRQILAPWTGTPMDSVLAERARTLADGLGYRVVRPRTAGLAIQAATARGSLAFVLEACTAFQPDRAAILAEVERLWPVIEDVTTWTAPVRGVVQTADGRPRPALVEWAADREPVGRAGRDGRFRVWLPRGPWRLTFAVDERRIEREIRVEADDAGSAPLTVKVGRCNTGLCVDDAPDLQEAGHRGKEDLRR